MPIDKGVLGFLGVDLATAAGPLNPRGTSGATATLPATAIVFVLEAGTQAPIEGAIVSINGPGTWFRKPGTTDKNGGATLEGFVNPTGSVQVFIFASARGYEPGSGLAVVHSSSPRVYAGTVLLDRVRGGGVQPNLTIEPSQIGTDSGRLPPRIGDFDYQYHYYDNFFRGAGPGMVDPSSVDR